MDLKNIRIFVRVAALQNLTGVAEEMSISPGTVSKRIQALEDSLGVRLIDRTTRSSRLTEEGRAFLARAERIMAEMDIALDEVRSASGRPAGRITITAPACLSRQLITPALVTFVEAFPDIEVRCDISDGIANLHEQGYDAAIRIGTLGDCALKAKRLAPDRVILAAAPRYLERLGEPGTPADLARHACLIQGEARTWTFRRSATPRTQETVRVAGRLASDSGDFLHEAALRGSGILKCSEITAEQDLARGALVRVLPDWEGATDAALWAVYPNAKHEMPRLRVFLDHLAEFCRETLASPARRDPGPAEVKPPARTQNDWKAAALRR